MKIPTSGVQIGITGSLRETSRGGDSLCDFPLSISFDYSIIVSCVKLFYFEEMFELRSTSPP